MQKTKGSKSEKGGRTFTPFRTCDASQRSGFSHPKGRTVGSSSEQTHTFGAQHLLSDSRIWGPVETSAEKPSKASRRQFPPGIVAFKEGESVFLLPFGGYSGFSLLRIQTKNNRQWPVPLWKLGSGRFTGLLLLQQVARLTTFSLK